jgi:hypothetical protein
LAVGSAGLGPRNEWSKTTAKTKNDSENARIDARERHLWLVRKGGLWGGSILTRGSSLPCRRGRITLHPPRELAAAAHHLIQLHARSYWRKRAAISHFSRQTWQRDLARAENREIVGVLERAPN